MPLWVAAVPTDQTSWGNLVLTSVIWACTPANGVRSLTALLCRSGSVSRVAERHRLHAGLGAYASKGLCQLTAPYPNLRRLSHTSGHGWYGFRQTKMSG